MNVVTFIPLSRARSLDTLSYFSDASLQVGDVCQIPMRNQKVDAIVSKIITIADDKSNIRTRNYNLRPLGKVTPSHHLPTSLVEAAEEIAKFYSGSVPVLLKSWLTKLDWIQESKLKVHDGGNTTTQKPIETKSIFWQSDYPGLLTLIKRLRQDRNQTIVVVVSDQNQVTAMQNVLNSYQPKIITGKTTKSAFCKKINHDLIITTGSFGPLLSLYFDRVVIINGGGDTWRNRRWPFTHWDVATKKVAELSNTSLVSWSTVFDSISWQDAKTTLNQNYNFVSDAYQRNIKFKHLDRSAGQKKIQDVVFDQFTQRLLKSNVENGLKSVIYVTRRGLYPVLVCNDCRKTTYTSEFKKQIDRHQLANLTSRRLDTTEAEEWVDRCKHCGSWRLKPIAISLLQTQAALKELELDDTTALIDTTAQTTAETKRLNKGFATESNKLILLTTQRGAYQLQSPIHSTIIVSIDAALSANSLNVETETLRLLWHLEHYTTGNFVLQTRLDDNQVIKTFETGLIKKYQDQQLKERSMLQFPPIYTQIKISNVTEMPLPYLKQLQELVSETLQGQLTSVPGLTSSAVVLITLTTDIWLSDLADPLRTYLVNLSTKNMIVINPDILL